MRPQGVSVRSQKKGVEFAGPVGSPSSPGEVWTFPAPRSPSHSEVLADHPVRLLLGSEQPWLLVAGSGSSSKSLALGRAPPEAGLGAGAGRRWGRGGGGGGLAHPLQDASLMCGACRTAKPGAVCLGLGQPLPWLGVSLGPASAALVRCSPGAACAAPVGLSLRGHGLQLAACAHSTEARLLEVNAPPRPSIWMSASPRPTGSLPEPLCVCVLDCRAER